MAELAETVADLARRPGHEAVRIGVANLLADQFGIPALEVVHEHRVPEVRGRIDTLVGNVVFEFKRDLAAEADDVARRLPDYLRAREAATGRPFIGVATDGATWTAHALRDGKLVELDRAQAQPREPMALTTWLARFLAESASLVPDPLTVQAHLGRDSPAFRVADAGLEAIWSRLYAHPEVKLKRDLWDGLLREAYGEPVGRDRLFLQHTYLSVVVKALAIGILHRSMPASAPAILDGTALRADGIEGAVERDFFDWPLLDPEGAPLLLRIARQAARFDLQRVQVDVLKGLYESLIDPEERHDLGEYYTPDWLAARVVAAAVAAPITDRVLDPACGSGTFLFHALRHLIAAAGKAGMSPAATMAAAAHVRGMDVHPVAVTIARVTWLLALEPVLRHRPGRITVPVYLGDAMQWNVRQVGDTQDVVVNVPGDDGRPITIPGGFAERQELLGPAVSVLSQGMEDGASTALVRARLAALPEAPAAALAGMVATYERLDELYRAGRNGIWPFVLRNLTAPLMLSRPAERADVLIGNPPWVAYRHLSPELKLRMRAACKAANLWVGGALATQQDLSALFWARAAFRYLRPGGRIAFVMPYAALNRPAFAGLRAGSFGGLGAVRIDAAWSFDEQVRPLFPVPACVLLGTRHDSGPLPNSVTRYAGNLPRRDASEAEAATALRAREDAWPPMPRLAGASPYRGRFRDGATIYPRRFFVVDRAPAGRFGPNPAAPEVTGRAGRQDKRPWRDLDPPRGPVEAAFLRPLILGETLAPFRLLEPALAVVPLEGRTVLDARGARDAGHRDLADWLVKVETLWAEHASKKADGALRMTLVQQLDHLRKLSAQAAPGTLRVAYAKAGTLMAACTIEDQAAVVDHMAYWTETRSPEEAAYLLAVLNSDAARRRIAPMQARGQGGPRHFDNLIWELPIPEFDRRNTLHLELAAAATDATRIAAAVPLTAGAYFTVQRRAIRDALAAAGLATRLDTFVNRLLAPG